MTVSGGAAAGTPGEHDRIGPLSKRQEEWSPCSAASEFPLFGAAFPR